MWLLAAWSPEETTGWAATLVPGRTKSREDQQWPKPPPLPEIAEAGDLPAVSGATVLTSRVSVGPGRPYGSARSDAEVADELATSITEVTGVRGGRGEALVRLLADRIAGPYSDVLRLTTAAGASNGPGPREPLHLLHRDTWGSTLRVLLEAAPKVQQPPAFAAEGADGPLRTRIACLMTLLSELLWVDNNTPVTFRFRLDQLGQGDGNRMTEAVRWWAESGENGENVNERGEGEFQTVSAAEFPARLRNGILFNRLWDEDDAEDGEELPDGHLVAFLMDDLSDLLLTRMGEGARIACAGYPSDGAHERITVLLAAGQEAAVLEVDLT
ncbi:hypothetical protein RM779_15580 [Streptomyces sp. DSM 41886]|uniref:Uncharacterized protein n=1 Tax=Streptomyces johnsoniae TaxID=3075532 RepID=A0ABU2S6E0_9ACTN|nr:hypothetical protein [Streptomyces sp. DSM 41886]